MGENTPARAGGFFVGAARFVGRGVSSDRREVGVTRCRKAYNARRGSNMMTLTIDEFRSRLPEIIEGLIPDEELVITRGDRPIARLLPPDLPKGVPVFGRGKGMLVAYIDDDEHLKDFAEFQA